MGENESKRMKNDASSESLLPEYVKAILNKGMSKGFDEGRLYLSMKKINDSMMPELCEWIIKLGDKVKILNLNWNEITSVGTSMLFDTLKVNNASMKEISLASNKNIDEECMKSVGEYIKSNKSIEILRLDSTSISDAGIEMLAPYFDGNTTFKHLDLNWNKGITDKSIPLLMKIIESSCIEEMHITGTSTTRWDIIYILSICNGIKYGSTRLLLSENDLNDDDMIKICESMKKYGIDKMKEIDLNENNITSKGASMLFDTLKECNSIVSHLDLSNNQLDDECMTQLGEYLQDNEYIKELKLFNNEITDKGAEILSEYLIGNVTLKELHLDGNAGITDTSIPYLIEMIKTTCIINMDLDDTLISDEKQQEINEVLLIPIEQREIPIKSNTKSAAKIQSSSASASP